MAQQTEPSGDVAEERVTLRGATFGPDGLPAADVFVLLDGVAVPTDASGGFAVEVAPGPHTIVVKESEQEILVGPNGAELLITVTSRGDVIFDVEGAIEAKEEVDLADPEPVEEEVVLGRVAGRVVSEEGAPIESVKVFVRAYDIEGTTDEDGRWSLEVPVGEHGIAFVHPDYTSVDRNVTVTEEGTTVDDTELVSSAVALDDFTVVAPRIEGSTVDLLEERRDADSVTEVIGAEEMSKTGASSAADAVTRVTGITVVGGKYVFVRGLGDRYSSTLLNGANLPSPEPEKRIVPLDLFPTDLLEAVLVQKTFSPDMPGEFGGGVVSLRTRTFPENFQANLGVSMKVDTRSTFREGLDSPGGTLDFLGVDDGSRRMPADLREASEEAPLKEADRFGSGGYSAEELEAFGEMLPNSWALQTRKLPPGLGLQASVGDGGNLLGARSGYRLGLTYDHETDHEVRQQNYYVVGAGGELERSNSYRFTTTNDNVVLGGIFTTGLEWSETDRIVLTSLFDRVSDAEDRVYEGFNRDVDADIRVTRYRWLERQLLFEQLKGEHEVFGLGLDWHYVFSRATRLEPDRRETRYDLRPNGRYELSDRPEGNSRVFSKLADNAHDVAASVDVPFSLGAMEPVVSVGGNAVFKDRGVDTRRFKYFGDVDPDLLALPPEELFVPENIGDGRFQFLEITRPTDNYEASQTIFAGWVDSKWPLLHWLEVGVGARLESSDQVVRTFELFNPSGTPVEARLQTLDVLPAAFATIDLTNDQKLRFAGSRTASRPDFRELSPQLFNDVTGGLAVQGNPDLERALITHADVRWEWYLSDGETLSVGAFYKHFQAPIESIIVPGAQQLKTFENAEGARNLGVEFEARKEFGFFGDAFRDFWFAGNVSLIDSKIRLDPTTGIQTSTERPLQGQSPWVANAQLGYDNVDAGTSLAVLFNIVGPRITEVGALGAPDIYEESVPVLDVVYRQKLVGPLKLGVKAKNLIDPEVLFTQGGRIVSSVYEGREFSLSLSADF